MSLINQMLKDLESRRQGKPLGRSVPVLRGGFGKRPRRLLMVGLVGALLLGGLLLGFATMQGPWSAWRGIRPLAPPLAQTETVGPADSAPAEIVVETPIADRPFLAKKVVLEALRVLELDTFIHFEAEFDRPPVYHVALAKDRRSLALELMAVRQAGEFPPQKGLRWLAEMHTRNDDSGVEVDLLLLPSLTIRDYSVTVQVAGSGYRLLLDVYPEAIPQKSSGPPASLETAETGPEISETILEQGRDVPTAPAASVRAPVHKIVELSDAERTEQAYHRAREALSRGRSEEGIAALRQLLRQHPSHLAALQTLSSELLKQQRPAEAGQVLAEGLRHAPEHWPLRFRYAQLLATEKQLDKAVELLLAGVPPSPPAMEQRQALLASLYQRSGRYPAAAEAYRELLARQPENPLWQMGLGIARDHAGASDEAVAAYRAALAAEGLSPALRLYVQQRLAVLQP